MNEHPATIGRLIAATLVKTLEQQAQSTREVLWNADEAVTWARQAPKGTVDVRYVGEWEFTHIRNLAYQSVYLYKKGAVYWSTAARAADDVKGAFARIQRLLVRPE